MKLFPWIGIFAALASYNAGLGIPKPAEPEIPAIVPVIEVLPDETVPPAEMTEPTVAHLYTDFYRTHFAEATEWNEIAYYIALPDLDGNGIPELIVQKAGASASDSLEVYTIEAGEVRAFSATSLTDIPVSVHAVDYGFEGSITDFNIHRDGDGESVYICSRNGSSDMSRAAWYRFTSENDALACEKVTAYVAEMTDWKDLELDIAVWDGKEYPYEEFVTLLRAWTESFYMDHPITDASWMENKMTHGLSDHEAAFALIEEICG